MRCPPRNYQHVTLLEGQRSRPFRCRSEPFPGLRLTCILRRPPHSRLRRPVNNQEDVIASLVILKLLRALLLLCRQDNRKRQRLRLVEIVIARFRLQRLHRIGKLLRRKDLKRLRRSRPRALTFVSSQRKLIRKRQSDSGGKRSCAKEVASKSIVDHCERG